MIPTLTIAIAALGALLLVLLGLRLRAVNEDATLKTHRARDAGLADLLNYAAVVDDGVIVGKNGAFLAAWVYQGDDQASSTDEGREAVSFRINQALATLGSGWMIHVDAVRRPAPHYPDRGRSHFPDPVCAAIDEERRRLFEGLGTMYEGYFVLTVTYFPPLLAQRKFVELMFDDDGTIPDHKARTRHLIESFKRECTAIESRLSSAVTLQRLRGEKVVRKTAPPSPTMRCWAGCSIASRAPVTRCCCREIRCTWMRFSAGRNCMAGWSRKSAASSSAWSPLKAFRSNPRQAS
jgi:hypothetical protein